MTITLRKLIERQQSDIDSIRKERLDLAMQFDEYEQYFSKDKQGGLTRLELMKQLWSNVSNDTTLFNTQDYLKTLKWYKNTLNVIDTIDELAFDKIYKFEMERCKNYKHNSLDNVAYIYNQLLLHDLAVVSIGKNPSTLKSKVDAYNIKHTIQTTFGSKFYNIDGVFKLEDDNNDVPIYLETTKEIEEFYIKEMTETI